VVVTGDVMVVAGIVVVIVTGGFSTHPLNRTIPITKTPIKINISLLNFIIFYYFTILLKCFVFSKGFGIFDNES